MRNPQVVRSLAGVLSLVLLEDLLELELGLPVVVVDYVVGGVVDAVAVLEPLHRRQRVALHFTREFEGLALLDAARLQVLDERRRSQLFFYLAHGQDGARFRRASGVDRLARILGRVFGESLLDGQRAEALVEGRLVIRIVLYGHSRFVPRHHWHRDSGYLADEREFRTWAQEVTLTTSRFGSAVCKAMG